MTNDTKGLLVIICCAIGAAVGYSFGGIIGAILGAVIIPIIISVIITLVEEMLNSEWFYAFIPFAIIGLIVGLVMKYN